MSAKLKLLLIGNGQWSQKAIVPTILSHFADRIDLTIGAIDLLDTTKPDGIIIATKDNHIEFANKALYRNIPVMVEKPLSLNPLDIKSLLDYNSKILVNHQHLFADNFKNLQEWCSRREIGAVHTYSTVTPNRNLVLSDYLPHHFAVSLKLQNSGIDNHTWNLSSGNRSEFKVIAYGLTDGLIDQFEYTDTANTVPPLVRSIEEFIEIIKGKPSTISNASFALKVLEAYAPKERDGKTNR